VQRPYALYLAAITTNTNNRFWVAAIKIRQTATKMSSTSTTTTKLASKFLKKWHYTGYTSLRNQSKKYYIAPYKGVSIRSAPAPLFRSSSEFEPRTAKHEEEAIVQSVSNPLARLDIIGGAAAMCAPAGARLHTAS
jgi:hypothetical protein